MHRLLSLSFSAAIAFLGCNPTAEIKPDVPLNKAGNEQFGTVPAPDPAESSSAFPIAPGSSAPSPANSSFAPPPPPTDTCSVIGPLTPFRYSPSLTRLNDGRILIAGGRQHDDSDFLADVIIYDPQSKSMRPGSKMQQARAIHGAALSGDGRVVVASGRVTKKIEVFDPKTNRWSSVGAFQHEVVHPVVAVLPSGNVLVAGGDLGWKGALSDEAFVFDIQTSKLRAIAPIPEPRAGVFALALTGGAIGLCGDRSRGMDSSPLSQLVYDEKTGWSRGPITDSRMKGLKELEGVWHEYELVEQVPAHRPPLLLAYNGILAFDVGEGKWKMIAKFALELIGATATMLDESTVFVTGSLGEERSVVEVCTVRW